MRKAVKRGVWMRWEDMAEVDRLLVRYEAPGIEHAAYEWCWGGDEWLVRPAFSAEAPGCQRRSSIT